MLASAAEGIDPFKKGNAAIKVDQNSSPQQGGGVDSRER